MYQVIKSKTPRDTDYPTRYYDLFIYKKVLDGTLYDCFMHPYGTEYTGIEISPQYVPETERAPCVNTGINICRSVVEQSVGFLFGEDRFPSFSLVEDEVTKQWIDDVVTDTQLVRVMQDVVTKGSIGSGAIQLKVLQDRFFPVVHETIFLTPTFDPQAPDTLTGIVEQKKVRGRDLRLAGYQIGDDQMDRWYWFKREWDDQEETW